MMTKNLRLCVTLSAILLGAFATSSCSLLNSALRLAIPLGMTKLYFSCLPEGTRIDTPEGSRAIEDLVVGDAVIGFTGEPVTVMQIHSYLEDPAGEVFLAVTFENGATVDLCGAHRIGGTRARDLAPGDVVAGQTVQAVAPFGSVERSYDLLTSDGGYRIGGVPVNSMIEEMAAAARSGSLPVTRGSDALPDHF